MAQAGTDLAMGRVGPKPPYHQKLHGNKRGGGEEEEKRGKRNKKGKHKHNTL
jgi:hypothetical protein